MKNAVGDSIWSLAKEFEEMTNKDDMFLADPDSHLSNGFQLVSHRSCYRLYKNTPSNKNAVITWYQDIEQARMINTCEASELADYMNEIDLEYVLVKCDRFETMDGSDMFDCYLGNDEYAVYKLKE